MKKRYYNATTHEWYNEGQAMTHKLNNGVFSGIPSAEQLYQWGFREWFDPAPTPAQLLERAKANKIAELEAYDDSNAVNGFIIRTPNGDFTEWLDPYKRNNASRAIESAKKLNIPTLTTAIGDIPVTLTTEDADLYLAQLEMYAVSCTGVTATHKAAINALETVEEVEAYDFERLYPEKLVFNVEEQS